MGQVSSRLRPRVATIPVTVRPDGPVAARRRALADARTDDSVQEDLCFLDAWEKGLVPHLSGFFRARQIRRLSHVRGVQGL
jgi:hypothetical protein